MAIETVKVPKVVEVLSFNKEELKEKIQHVSRLSEDEKLYLIGLMG